MVAGNERLARMSMLVAEAATTFRNHFTAACDWFSLDIMKEPRIVSVTYATEGRAYVRCISTKSE